MAKVMTGHQQRTAASLRKPRWGTWFGMALLAMAAAVAANTLLGPLFADAIAYPFGETMRSQTLGLEAFSLAVIAPLSALAGVLALQGRRESAVLAVGPAAYTAYMFAQYVIGPEYTAYQPAQALHLGVFILSGGILLRAWALTESAALPAMSWPARRRWAAGLFAVAAFAVARYLSVLAGMATGAALAPAALEDVSMYWTIVLLDLGVVAPAAIASGIALLRGVDWSQRALYGVIGWFALVPPSVAAMSLVMAFKGDAYATWSETGVFIAAALAFVAVAARLFWPLAAAGRRDR